jgi:hypothetical protein
VLPRQVGEAGEARLGSERPQMHPYGAFEASRVFSGSPRPVLSHVRSSAQREARGAVAIHDVVPSGSTWISALRPLRAAEVTFGDDLHPSGELPVNEHSADRAVHSYLATFFHAVYEEVGLVAADHRLARHRHELSTPLEARYSPG